ncbi:MAG: COP23 domain-containing protein [Xenococcaceae cyanobacterium MO_234.B1]|nr:COP23 domain-containing protein [Xenococcaceae cyanobacterium MO_234.B1]
MKIKEIKSIVVAGALALSTLAAIGEPSKAQTYSKYFCGNSEDDVPTTFFRTVTGSLIPIIRWEIEWGGEYTPLDRCYEVSLNFQKAYERGNLNYLLVGEKNNYKTICSTRLYGGECSNHLFTLRDDDTPDEILEQLNNMGSRVGSPIRHDSEGKVITQRYILLNRELRSPRTDN